MSVQEAESSKRLAAEELKERLNVEPKSASATGTHDAHLAPYIIQELAGEVTTEHTDNYYMHNDPHMAAQPTRREHFICTQSQNENEAGLSAAHEGSLCQGPNSHVGSQTARISRTRRISSAKDRL